MNWQSVVSFFRKVSDSVNRVGAAETESSDPWCCDRYTRKKIAAINTTRISDQRFFMARIRFANWWESWVRKTPKGLKKMAAGTRRPTAIYISSERNR